MKQGQRITYQRRIRFDLPTVACSIKYDPYLLGRSYLSTFVDLSGKRVRVDQPLPNWSQAKQRRRARRQNRLVND